MWPAASVSGLYFAHPEVAISPSTASPATRSKATPRGRRCRSPKSNAGSARTWATSRSKRSQTDFHHKGTKTLRKAETEEKLNRSKQRKRRNPRSQPLFPRHGCSAPKSATFCSIPFVCLRTVSLLPRRCPFGTMSFGTMKRAPNPRVARPPPFGAESKDYERISHND